ncbi:type II toxin-antitoxin system RelE/ParE family toxin [Zhaonella formicivorans]|uniref:type II toxin-antitoxin system RelE/ParE family toxin n=1 Tax=Zhaonella formicivorans TaxID=2528593 RepID=UPI0010D2504E
MSWSIIFYKNNKGERPVVEWLDTLPKKDRAKVLRNLQLLEEFGLALDFPYTSEIKGTKLPLRELRTKFSTNQYRVIYFAWINNTFVALHGLTKKDWNISQGDIKIAEKRYFDFLHDPLKRGGASNE